jgi:hypothetical protein
VRRIEGLGPLVVANLLSRALYMPYGGGGTRMAAGHRLGVLADRIQGVHFAPLLAIAQSAGVHAALREMYAGIWHRVDQRGFNQMCVEHFNARIWQISGGYTPARATTARTPRALLTPPRARGSTQT